MGSSSPPPTPSREMPRSEADHRFVQSGLPCEWLESYRPGGLHPVIIGDTLHNGRYRVLRKLGDGSFSTVWLAVDREPSEHKYVSVKVMMSKYSQTGKKELEMQSRVTTQEHRPGRQNHVLRLLNSFEETGPNGLHLCLVHEPMATTVASGIDSLPQYQNSLKKFGETRRYPKWMVKRILRHTLVGLTQLHTLGIVHGDLQPGNLLFDVHGLDNAPEGDLKQDIGKTTAKVTRLDGKEDKWAPPYLAVGQNLAKYADFGESFKIEISDLGAAFYRGQQAQKIVTPVALRAPETILNQQVDEKIDIWSFGVLVYELLTGTMLFPVASFSGFNDDDEATDGDHMLAFNDILGDLPDNLMALWPRSKSWFGPNRERLNPLADQGGDEFISDPLEVEFEKYKPQDIGAEESEVIISLIRGILSYELSKRPTAETILQHEWFSQE